MVITGYYAYQPATPVLLSQQAGESKSYWWQPVIAPPSLVQQRWTSHRQLFCPYWGSSVRHTDGWCWSPVALNRTSALPDLLTHQYWCSRRVGIISSDYIPLCHPCLCSGSLQAMFLSQGKMWFCECEREMLQEIVKSLQKRSISNHMHLRIQKAQYVASYVCQFFGGFWLVNVIHFSLHGSQEAFCLRMYVSKTP